MCRTEEPSPPPFFRSPNPTNPPARSRNVIATLVYQRRRRWDQNTRPFCLSANTSWFSRRFRHPTHVPDRRATSYAAAFTEIVAVSWVRESYTRLATATKTNPLPPYDSLAISPTDGGNAEMACQRTNGWTRVSVHTHVTAPNVNVRNTSSEEANNFKRALESTWTVVVTTRVRNETEITKTNCLNLTSEKYVSGEQSKTSSVIYAW